MCPAWSWCAWTVVPLHDVPLDGHCAGVGDAERRGPRRNKRFRVIQMVQGNMGTKFPDHLPLPASSLL